MRTGLSVGTIHLLLYTCRVVELSCPTDNPGCMPAVTPLLSSYTEVYTIVQKKKERSRALQFTYKLTAEELKVIETRPLFSQPMMYYLRK